MPKSLKTLLANNHYADWLTAAGVAAVVLVVFYLLQRLVVHRVADYAKRTASAIDDAIADILGRTKLWFGLAVAIYLGAHSLTLPERVARVLDHFIAIAVIVQLAVFANRALALWLGHYLAEKRERDAASATTLSVLGFIGRVALWSITLLLILDNLGVNITALVTGLGIGGVAVALAVQNILGDIFASLSIALDKPFVIGDFIVVGEHLGTVEYIGLKTTRIRSLSGEQIVFGNADLLESVIRNYKRMDERRVLFQFGAIYQTPYEKLVRIPAIVREIVESLDKTRFDRAHFKAYGDSSLDFEVVYSVRDPDYNLYRDIQQAINLALFRRFAEEGIEFAYPTRTLYLAHTARPAAMAAGGEARHD